MFGLDAQLGTVGNGQDRQPDRHNGDPLEVTTDIRYLLIKGQLTSTDNKQKALYEKYLAVPKPPAEAIPGIEKKLPPTPQLFG